MPCLHGPGHRPPTILGYLGASFLKLLVSWVRDDENLLVQEGP